MGKVKSGFNKQTKEHLLLGAGAFFKNFIVGQDTYESARAANKLIGATQGGGEFKAIAEIRQIEIDGVAGRIKGGETLDSWETSLAINLIETTEETIKLALGAAEIDSITNSMYHIVKGKSEIEDIDYIDNVTYIGTISGSGEPVIIQVLNALSTDGLDIKTEDKKEAVIAVTVYGHYTEDDLDRPPFDIFYPKKGNVDTVIADVKGRVINAKVSVNLSCKTQGAEIYYTTNGFEPTNKSTKFTSGTAIEIDNDTILKAKAFKSGMPDSLTMTEIYIKKVGP